MSISEGQMRKISQFANERYKIYDDTHGQDHATKTIKLAIYLAKKEKADLLICELGAMLHQYHPENAEIVRSFLSEIGIEGNLRDKIVHCVECIEFDTIIEASTLEAKVVFDADKLQTIGPYGLVREVIYRTRNGNVDFMTATREAQDLQIRSFKSLQTKTARNLVRDIEEFSRRIFHSIEEWDTLSFIDIPAR